MITAYQGGSAVPEISRFYGMVVAMFFNDHEPPHFHVRYGSYKAILALGTLEVLRGDLPGRALALVREWARLHADELQEDWRRARASQPLNAIDPLQ
jgi:hypothetical protein